VANAADRLSHAFRAARRGYDPSVTRSLYDGLADEYDDFLRRHGYEGARDVLRRLLGRGIGACLDVGCGGGYFLDVPRELGWQPVGTDASGDQLRVARRRHPRTHFVLADAARLPFAGESFDAAISMFTHTDFDDFAAAVREVRRVLRPGSPFVYIGNHPCFVGPTQEFQEGGVPRLHPGYRQAGRWEASEAPGTTPGGWRTRVGSLVHLPLGEFLACFSGFTIETAEELADAFEYPRTIGLRVAKP
jgi:SAM-dependent methyltransferase